MSPELIVEQFPALSVELADGVRLGYRQSGAAGRVTQVLLHGIGSGSASWAYQLAAAKACGQRVLAWEAPGYGQSTGLDGLTPDASAYAERLWQWLDRLEVSEPVTLVGHSLGCIMAARAARLQPQRVQALVLLSPARGYGLADAALREDKLHSRLSMLERLGPEGMARERGAAMLSPTAHPDLVSAVRQTMSKVQVAGYRQATHLLSQSDLDTDLQTLTCPITVASGSVDAITPMAACQAVAHRLNQDWQDLGPVGHACTLEACGAVNALLGLGAPESATSNDLRNAQ